jgi:hypothetical protein
MKAKVLLIVDIKLSEFFSNKPFQFSMISWPGLGFYPYLSKILDSYGIEYLTLDLYKNRVADFQNYKKYVISYECSPKEKEYYIKHNIVMFMSYSGESPINALKYHKNINRISSHFHFIYGFSGVSNLLEDKSNFRTFNWPMHIEPYSGVEFKNRSLLAFIATAKSKYAYGNRFWASYYIRKPRYLLNLLIKLLHRKYGKDISVYRFDYIKKLAPHKDFHLYGRGWDVALKKDSFFRSTHFANTPKEIKNKGNELQNFKFTLCFENTRFQGYITEKIFDSMLAGSVPIYLGTKEIQKVVPLGCFINAEDFANPEELLNHIRSIDEEKWEEYHSKILEFVNSDDFKNVYNAKTLANELWNELKRILL